MSGGRKSPGESEDTSRNNLSQGKMGEMQIWDMSQGCAELARGMVSGSYAAAVL